MSDRLDDFEWRLKRVEENSLQGLAGCIVGLAVIAITATAIAFWGVWIKTDGFQCLIPLRDKPAQMQQEKTP